MSFRFPGIFLLVFFISCSGNPTIKESGLPDRPNIVFIAVDDLNDWTGALGGHPQAYTPNIDRLAAMGMTFTNAHCQAPVCNPSRASMMASLYPSTTGIYFLHPDIDESEVAKENVWMPQRFEQEGYYVAGAGKLYHNAGGVNEEYIPNYAGNFGGFGPLPEERLTDFPGLRLWDWGSYPASDSLMPDYKIAEWAVQQIQQDHDSALWLGVGFFRPHVPQFAPQKWFDLFPSDSVRLPATLDTDLADIPEYGRNITRLEHVHPDFAWVEENDQWVPLVQSYLACVSFVDAQVGKVLDALEASVYSGNTYIVLWSDHGFHMGEKERFAKRSLWEDGTRVPLIIAGPGITPGMRSHQPVQLLDVYPTLLELAHLESDSLLEGHSLVPLLQGNEEWAHMARTSFGPGNYAIVSEQYRYIRYNDGSEEFYDHSTDPNEWHNLIGNESYEAIIDKHRRELPESHHPVLGEGSTGHKSYETTEALVNSR